MALGLSELSWGKAEEKHKSQDKGLFRVGFRLLDEPYKVLSLFFRGYTKLNGQAAQFYFLARIDEDEVSVFKITISLVER